MRYLATPGATLGRLQQLLGYDDAATTARYLAALDVDAAPAPIGYEGRLPLAAKQCGAGTGAVGSTSRGQVGCVYGL